MGATFEVASPKFEPLFTLKDPETGERPNHIVLPGGRASAKTVSASLAVIYHMRNKKLLKAKRGLRVVIARQFGSSIDESFWSELESAASLMGVWHEFVWGNKVITHKITGSTVTSIGLDRNKGNIKGLAQVDLVIVEEAAYVTSESIETLVPTIRKNFSVIMWLYNPMNKNDAVAQKFVECDIPYPKTLIIETNWRDNKFLSERAKADKDALLPVPVFTSASVVFERIRLLTPLSVSYKALSLEPKTPDLHLAQTKPPSPSRSMPLVMV